MPQSPRKLLLSERRAIRDRLTDFVRRHYPSRLKMEADVGASHSTVAGWFHKDPSTPDTLSLVRLAQRKNLDLNWLLLGEGAELRGVAPSPDVWAHLRSVLVSELKSHGVAALVAEKLAPDPEQLFHLNVAHALEIVLKASRPRPSIAGMIQDYLQSHPGGPTVADRTSPRIPRRR